MPDFIRTPFLPNLPYGQLEIPDMPSSYPLLTAEEVADTDLFSLTQAATLRQARIQSGELKRLCSGTVTPPDTPLPTSPIYMDTVLQEGRNHNNYSTFLNFMNEQDPDKFLWLHFPEGIWTAYPDSGSGFRAGFKMRRGNFKLTGAGRFKTMLWGNNMPTFPTFSVYTDLYTGYNALTVESYQSGLGTGWPLIGPFGDDYQYPFEDGRNTFGSTHLALKMPAHAARFAVGDHISIWSGANGYDVEHGEHNIVRAVDAVNGILYFEYPMVRDYRSSQSPAEILLSASFVQPAPNATVNVTFNKQGLSLLLGVTHNGISYYTIEDNIYDITAMTGSSATLRNVPNVGNASAGTPIGGPGSKVLQVRTIKNISTVGFDYFGHQGVLRNPGNVVIEDISIHGWDEVFNSSSVINGRYDRVRIVSENPADYNAMVLVTDGGRDITFRDCDVIAQSPYPRGHITSRAMSGLKYINCNFNQMKLGMGEFANGLQVLGGRIAISHPDSNPNNNMHHAITFDGTCSGGRIMGVDIYARNIHGLILGQGNVSQLDSQRWRREERALLRHNRIQLDGVGVVLYNLSNGARFEMSENDISGSFDGFAGWGSLPFDTTSDVAFNTLRFPDGSDIRVNRNDVRASFSSLFPLASYFEAVGNTFMLVDFPGNPTATAGMIIFDYGTYYGTPTQALIKRLTLADNTFVGFPQVGNLIVIPNPESATCRIENNRYLP